MKIENNCLAYEEDEVLDFLYQDILLKDIPLTVEDKEKIIKFSNYFDTEPETNFEIPLAERTNQWNFDLPDIDIKKFLIDRCKTPKEIERVELEYDLYVKYNLLTILKLMIYLVDIFRKNNIVWGVGRGSSVSSFCLYLIGVHKIDSLKYDLDIEDFLKP